MTREKKFRAWDGTKFIRSGHCVEFDGSVHEYKQGAVIERKDLVLMQFTGLLDKNGKEIYEGDIVKCYQAQGIGYVTGIVHFGIEDRNGWPDPRIYLDTRPFQENNGSEFCIFHKSPEIIGNRYSTPELLTT